MCSNKALFMGTEIRFLCNFHVMKYSFDFLLICNFFFYNNLIVLIAWMAYKKVNEQLWLGNNSLPTPELDPSFVVQCVSISPPIYFLFSFLNSNPLLSPVVFGGGFCDFAKAPLGFCFVSQGWVEGWVNPFCLQELDEEQQLFILLYLKS